MLDCERALAEAEAELGRDSRRRRPRRSPRPAGPSCSTPTASQPRAAASGNPAEPLVRALRAAVGGDAAGYVHHGATSQDIVDTAAMLVATRALATVLADVAAVTAACAELADAHRDDADGRAHAAAAGPADDVRPEGGDAGSPACSRPSSSSLAAADRAGGRSSAARPARWRRSASDGPDVVAARRAATSAWPSRCCPWHTSRVRVAALGSALAIARRIARQDRARRGAAGADRGRRGERAGRRGPRRILDDAAQAAIRSASILTLACARRAQAAADLLTGTLVQEHERAAGAWQAEWDAIAGVLAAAGGAAASMAEVLTGLRSIASGCEPTWRSTRGLSSRSASCSRSPSASARPTRRRSSAQRWRAPPNGARRCARSSGVTRTCR